MKSWPRILLIFSAIGIMAFLLSWQLYLADDSHLVVYFGHPIDAVSYCEGNWPMLLRASVRSVSVAIASLVLAGITTLILLVLGMRHRHLLKWIERLAAGSQTVPFLVVVTLSLILQKLVFDWFEVRQPIWVYCLVPVTVALLFPPLACGVDSFLRFPFNLKAMLRLWQAPEWRRIRRIYLPAVAPDVMTGLRTSATWAISATLITEGLLHGIEGDSETLGHFLLRPFSSGTVAGRTPTVIIVATLLGFIVYLIFSWLKRRIDSRILGKSSEFVQGYLS